MDREFQGEKVEGGGGEGGGGLLFLRIFCQLCYYLASMLGVFLKPKPPFR